VRVDTSIEFAITNIPNINMDAADASSLDRNIPLRGRFFYRQDPYEADR